MSIRVGLAGYGLGGRVFHAPLIRRVEGLEITAAYSPSERTRELASRELGIEATSDWQRFLGSDIDLVALVTPHDTHCPLALEALAAGKHVVVDKVMCLDLEEGRRMVAAAESAGKLLSTYQNRRWDGDFLTVRRLLHEGVLGELLVVEARWTSPALSRRAEWRLQHGRGGGMLLDLGAHMIDQLALLAGPVQSVSCVMLHTDPSTDVETYAECRLGFRSGVLGVMEVSAITQGRRARWYLRGTKAGYRKFGLDPQEGVLRGGGIPSDQTMQPEPGNLLRVRDGELQREEVPTALGDWSLYYRNVRDAIRGEAELAVKPVDCLHGLSVLLAAARSAERGGTLETPEEALP